MDSYNTPMWYKGQSCYSQEIFISHCTFRKAENREKINLEILDKVLEDVEGHKEKEGCFIEDKSSYDPWARVTECLKPLYSESLT